MPTENLDEVFELLDMDIHEVSVVDNTANDTEWLLIKSIGVGDFGDFATIKQPARAPAPTPAKKASVLLDPAEKQSILSIVRETKASVDRLIEFVDAAEEQANAPTPDAIGAAAKMIGNHLLVIAGSSLELEALGSISKALAGAPAPQANGEEAATMATSAINKAIDEIQKRDQIIADQRRHIAKLENQVQPGAATHPERARKARSQEPQEPDFPYMFHGGKPVGAGR